MKGDQTMLVQGVFVVNRLGGDVFLISVVKEVEMSHRGFYLAARDMLCLGKG